MKKRPIALALMLTGAMGLCVMGGCEKDAEDHLDDAADNIEDTAEDLGDAAEEAAEDLGDAAEDAGEEMQRRLGGGTGESIDG